MTDYVTPTTWEECARHVEAGGIVEVFDGFDEWLDEGVGPSGFRSRPRRPGIGTWEAPRRLVPIETEATGAERYLAGRLDDPEYAEAYRKERGAIDVPDGYEAVWLPSETVDEFGAGEDDRVSRGHVVAGAREAQARRGTTPAPPPAPSLVPPWPGAVLSGLTDEDGVPTWLAQAGQVRGEAVRLRHRDDEWATWATLDGDEWVEVRAPRAAPEPETERVPWWEAVEDDRDVTAAQGGPTFSAWLRLRDPEGDWWLVVNGCTDLATAYKQKIAPDGTVEVLKDGES